MSSPATGIKVVMGGTGMLRKKPAPRAPELFAIMSKYGVDTIDSGVTYGDSEEVLGLHGAGDRFVLDTKIPGGLVTGSSTRDRVVRMGRESLEKMKVRQVDVLYVHTPDTSVPFEDTLAGLDELYREGMFRRLGLSNFKPEQVQQVYDICLAKGYVLPSVYQGKYNAFARSYEMSLFPLLRKLGISFYAYSPQAGGFLNKTSDVVRNGKGEGKLLGHEVSSVLYKALYKKPLLLDGLTKWNEIADSVSLNPGSMAVRWVRFNSGLKPEYGDALIVGGRTIEQVDQTLAATGEGPLDRDIVTKIDEVWETVKAEAPVDNWHDFIEQNMAH